MADVYSQRNAPARDVLRYDLPNTVRWRVFITLQQICHETASCNFDSLLDELGKKLIAQYGGLAHPQYDATAQHSNPVINHFLCCSDDHALDYLEFFFRCRQYLNVGQTGVDAVNAVFREEGIGYELSNWIAKVERAKGPMTRAGLYAVPAGAWTLKIEYPRIIRKDTQFTHSRIVKPCLDVLAKPEFARANKEMLDAFAKHRRADFDGALTSCGSAFESVFKTICTLKNWPYDPDKDTLNKLVDICNAKGLFPPFYAEVFKSVGTVRNKLSDAHGRGPVPQYDVGQDHLEHMIHFVSAHIVFLAKLSGI
jgi:hypothetical protein